MKISDNNPFKHINFPKAPPPASNGPSVYIPGDSVSLGASAAPQASPGAAGSGQAVSGGDAPSVDPSPASLNGVNGGQLVGLSGKVLAESPQTEGPKAGLPSPSDHDLNSFPFLSVDNSPAPPKNLHTKMVIVDDSSKDWAKDPGLHYWTEDKGSIWMDDPALSPKAGNSGPHGKTFQETLAELGKEFAPKSPQPSLEDKATMAAMMSKMASLGAGMMMGMAGMGGMLGGMIGAGFGSLGAGLGAMPLAGKIGPAAGSPPSPKPQVPLATPQAPLATPQAPVTSSFEGLQDPKAMTPAQRTNFVRQSVQANLAKMGASGSFKVDTHLFPLLDRVGLDANEFFTARACWQGVSSKRRRILEKVLDEFPTLPKDQKNVEAAMAAAQGKGTKITETDRYFLRYFFEHRKEMKTLFRASLNRFEGDKVTVYRGQSDDPKWGEDSTKPLGCYSFDPSVSEIWGDNLKRYKVKLSDVWSTSVISQNSHRHERELTVYSRGGTRKGEKILRAQVNDEIKKFNSGYIPNNFMRQAEGQPPVYTPSTSGLSPNLKTDSSPSSQAPAYNPHQTPAYGSD